MIHHTAVVSPLARLAEDVEVHPYCVVEEGASIGAGCVLESRTIVKQGVTLGMNNRVFEGAVLGGLPQHVKVPAETGGLTIGDGNVIRENVTIHRGLNAGHATIVGDNNLLMVNCHVAHDCHIGNHTIFANNVMLAGHVTVEDRAYVSGAVGVHQFCRIGKFAMVGGQSHVSKDVPPYVTVDGKSHFIVGLNQVGLRRNGFTRDDIAQLKAAYRLIYRSGLAWTEVLDRLAAEFHAGPAAAFHEFFSGGRRGFTPERRMPKHSTIKLVEAAEFDEGVEIKAKAG